MATIEERVEVILVDFLAVDESQVTPEATLEDLGADSLDAIELLMEFESQFDLEISDEDAEKIHTVSDAVEYVRQHHAE